MNIIAQGYCKKILKQGDEILISELEHASNLLPWFKIAKETKAVIKYVELDFIKKLQGDNKIKPRIFKSKIKIPFVTIKRVSLAEMP